MAWVYHFGEGDTKDKYLLGEFVCFPSSRSFVRFSKFFGYCFLKFTGSERNSLLSVISLKNVLDLLFLSRHDS